MEIYEKHVSLKKYIFFSYISSLSHCGSIKSMQSWYLLVEYYRVSVLVIDGKNNNDDGK
jgi:hypothetical protein